MVDSCHRPLHPPGPGREATYPEKHNIRHSNKVLVAVIPENKDVRVDSGTAFFFGQHNVEVAIEIEVGSIDGPVTAGEHHCTTVGANVPLPRFNAVPK